MMTGPKGPDTMEELRSYRALAAKGLATQSGELFTITPEGKTARLYKKAGAKSTFTGDWAKLADKYGGPFKLAETIGVCYSSVRNWALRGMRPGEPTVKLVGRLAQAADVPDPFRRCERCLGLKMRERLPSDPPGLGDIVPCECSNP